MVHVNLGDVTCFLRVASTQNSKLCLNHSCGPNMLYLWLLFCMVVLRRNYVDYGNRAVVELRSAQKCTKNACMCEFVYVVLVFLNRMICARRERLQTCRQACVCGCVCPRSRALCARKRVNERMHLHMGTYFSTNDVSSHRR